PDGDRGERPLPRFTCCRLRDGARPRRQRRHGHVAADRRPEDRMHIARALLGGQLQREVHARLFAEHRDFLGRLANLPAAFGAAGDTPVGTTPCDVVLQRRAFRLLRYRRQTPATYAEPVLFCYALVNRSYILDLQPDKSVVAQYLARGFDVYMI